MMNEEQENGLSPYVKEIGKIEMKDSKNHPFQNTHVFQCEGEHVSSDLFEDDLCLQMQQKTTIQFILFI